MEDKTVEYFDLIEAAYDRVDIYDGPDAFFAEFSKLPPPQQHLLAAHWCQSEINNGGFDQFFANPTGMLAPEAEKGFRAIGMPVAADIVAAAIAMFGPEYPREREDRDRMLSKMPHRMITSKVGDTFRRVDAFDALDDQFYDAAGDFCEHATRYATANAG